MTVLARLVAKEEDGLGYVTYVFEILEENSSIESKYVMCTRYPNWSHRKIDLGEEGYLSFFEIRAGIDTWFDGSNLIPYNYDGVRFSKFIAKPVIKDFKYVM